MKYIFIDTNQYRHIFSKSEGFSDDVYNLILKLIDEKHMQLLLPQQVKDETERNKLYKWPEQEDEGIKKEIEQLKKKEEILENNFKEYNCEKIKKEIVLKKKELDKDLAVVAKKFQNLKSKPNQKIKKLFEKSTLILETNDIIDKAEIRFKKGNPPYDSNDFGDTLIWELLISFISKKKTEKPELIFVSNDKKAWGDDYFHLWLEKEYKEKTTGKIFYSKMLSNIPGLTQAEQDAIKEKENEELRINTITDFINSVSFVDAGNNAKKLLVFKKFLTDSDYRKIFIASIRNHEIYQSFFSKELIIELFNIGNGYVVSTLEQAPKTSWDRFCSFYGVKLKRHADETQNDKLDEEEINLDDIPF